MAPLRMLASGMSKEPYLSAKREQEKEKRDIFFFFLFFSSARLFSRLPAKRALYEGQKGPVDTSAAHARAVFGLTGIDWFVSLASSLMFEISLLLLGEFVPQDTVSLPRHRSPSHLHI